MQASLSAIAESDQDTPLADAPSSRAGQTPRMAEA